MFWVGCPVILILSFRLDVGVWFERALADWLLPESSTCWLDFACVLVIGLWVCWFFGGFLDGYGTA